VSFKSDAVYFYYGVDAMKQVIFKGSACAIITPFEKSGRIDYKTLKKNIDFQISNSTDAIVVCGTTGESSVLSDREHRQMIKSVIKYVEGRVPVIAGVGSNCTQKVLRRSEAAEECGADGLLIVTPYYNKTSQEGLIEHYLCIARHVSTPIITYNVPTRTGVDIKPETYKELSKVSKIVATKEANGNLSALMKTMELCGDNLNIYCGNDDHSAAFVAMGAIGTISVLANLMPQQAHDIAVTGINGDIDLSAALQKKYLEMCNVLFCDVNPVPIKYAMSLVGLCRDVYRLPLVELNDKNKSKVISAMKHLDII